MLQRKDLFIAQINRYLSQWPRSRTVFAVCGFVACCGFTTIGIAAEGPSTPMRWWKGNLHTHSFWSDGDDFPETIVAWYKEHGYDFLALSDHNVLQEGPRWITIGTNEVRQAVLEKYLARFGPDWVETRGTDGKREVRLKPLTEFRALFEEAGRFLLIRGEEITDGYKEFPVHINASNLRDYIPPQGGNSVREVMQNNVDAVFYQRRMTGRRILPHLNHPNFHWGVTAEDLARVRGEHFFEVYNGHPTVADLGDDVHAGTERIWDIALTLRLTGPDPEPLFGVGVDDSHNYQEQSPKLSNSGRGWIMVRARHLTPESIIRAMEEGDFYASSGVTLKDVRVSSASLTVEIEPRPGVTYRTQFIGTRRGFDSASEPVIDASGKPLPVTRRYSDQVGEVFAEVAGAIASYRFREDELYVRARVISSQPKENPSRVDEKEMAWIQPVIR